MEWFTYFIMLWSLGEGLEASPNKRSMDILNCLSCGLNRSKCSEEYNCFPKKAAKHVGKSSPLDSPVHCQVGNYTRAILQCYDESLTEMDCTQLLPVNTLVRYRCPTFYRALASTFSICQNDGTWSEEIRCIPECGKTFTNMPLTPLILNGAQVQSRSQWPWSAALYRLMKDGTHYTYHCGATLVGDDLLVTAAHCTYYTTSSNLLVVVDKFYKEIPKDEANKYGYKVKRAYRLPVFNAMKKNYNSDISTLVLESRVTLSETVLPACLPSNNITITPYTHGIVAGWETPLSRQMIKEKGPRNLVYIKVPIIDTFHCVAKMPERFITLLAFTTFCAGYTNGTGVCRRDTGSGLLTMNSDGLWELQGVVCFNPSFKTKPKLSCYSGLYSFYTKVFLFLDWINKIIKFEEMGTPAKSRPHN